MKVVSPNSHLPKSTIRLAARYDTYTAMNRDSVRHLNRGIHAGRAGLGAILVGGTISTWAENHEGSRTSKALWAAGAITTLYGVMEVMCGNGLRVAREQVEMAVYEGHASIVPDAAPGGMPEMSHTNA